VSGSADLGKSHRLDTESFLRSQSNSTQDAGTRGGAQAIRESTLSNGNYITQGLGFLGSIASNEIQEEKRVAASLEWIAVAIKAQDVVGLEKIRSEAGRKFTQAEHDAVSKGIEGCEKAIRTVRDREMIKVAQMRFDKGLSTDLALITIYNQQRELQGKAIKSGKLCRDWVWGVITPEKEVDLQTMRNYARKCVTKDWIKEYYISFEQRGESVDNIHGMHIHILFQFDKTKGYKFCKAKKRTENTLGEGFKYFWGDDKTALTDHEHIKKKEYMEGKKSKSKIARVMVDKEMRKMNGLLDIYTKENIQEL